MTALGEPLVCFVIGLILVDVVVDDDEKKTNTVHREDKSSI